MAKDPRVIGKSRIASKERGVLKRMDDVRKAQRAFGRKAVAQPEHRFDKLYRLMSRKEWLEEATKAVLSNKGARTPGVDGMSKEDLKSERAYNAFITSLQTDLRAGIYRPQPVQQVWIPKPNGGQRPLGIPTIRDRVVQMLLKMLLEPIWESDFLEISYGFRPNRRTMDCIAWCYMKIQPHTKHFWVIEGDIKGCFDHIDHDILLKLVRRRIADKKVVAVIGQMLRAGILENELYHDTDLGTPQGGIVSPLLANIYLHELDRWWWEHYGNLARKDRKRIRRKGYGGGVFFLRYADDFILLTSGTKRYAHDVREALAQFLMEELKLELAMEKTHVTHVSDGFDFLGFHLQWHTPRNGNPWLRVTPSKKNVRRYRDRINEIVNTTTAHTRFAIDVFMAINRVKIGWGEYYRHVNSKAMFSTLDTWTFHRLTKWLQQHHKKGIRWVLRKYYARQVENGHNRKNLYSTSKKGNPYWLFQMSDMKVSRYWLERTQNPYREGEHETQIETGSDSRTPRTAEGWVGQNRHPDQEYGAVLKALERAGHKCEVCGSREQLQTHRIIPGLRGGKYELSNVMVLCWECHKQTDTYGHKVHQPS
jgi:RNA-directed DNA polymerase